MRRAAPPISLSGWRTVTVRNTGGRSGAEVVQLYLHDPVASVVQPVQRLVGYTRLELEPGEARRVRVTVPADLASSRDATVGASSNRASRRCGWPPPARIRA